MAKFRKVTEIDILSNLINLKHLVFEVTDACNLNCKYCAFSELYEGYDKRENLYLSFRRAKLIIDFLHAYWSEYTSHDFIHPISLSFYGGEPTLNMKVIREIISYIESLPSVGRLFSYNMTTNAMLLDRYMDYLVEKKFDLLISLDGDERGQSYRVDCHGNNSFEHVCRNIQLLYNTHPKYYKEHVTFNTVIHNRNGVNNAFRFIKSHFNKTPILSPVSVFGVRKDKQEEFNSLYCDIMENIEQSPNHEILAQEVFLENPSIYFVWDYIRKYSGNYYNNYSQLLFDKDKVTNLLTGTCLPFMKKMFVTVNGKILQCEKISHQFVLGTVDDTKVNLDFAYVAKCHNDYTCKYVEQCDNCAQNRTCGMCVYIDKEVSLKEKKCPRYIEQQELDERCIDGLRYLNIYPNLYNKILTRVSSK